MNLFERIFKSKNPVQDEKTEPEQPMPRGEVLRHYFICAVQELFRPEYSCDPYKKSEVAKFQMDDEQLLAFLMWMGNELDFTIDRMNETEAREKANIFYQQLIDRVKANHKN